MISRNNKPLKFGTSGLRDNDENLTDREVYVNTKGFIEYLISLGKNCGGISQGDTIYLARDFRPSSAMGKIPRAVALAVMDSGCTPGWCGAIPTPAVTYFGMQRNCATIMVTGSHIPYGMNGIKFGRPGGEILKEEEKPIFSYVEQTRSIVLSLEPQDSFFDEKGWIKPSSLLSAENANLVRFAEQSLQKVDDQAKRAYISRYSETFGHDALEGMEIIFFQHTAVGRDILPDIFENLGAKVHRMGRMDEEREFLPLDTEKMKPEIRASLKSIAGEFRTRFGRLPAAVLSSDGDSDRPVLCNGKGEFLPGDKLGALVSLYLKPGFVAMPITCNSSAVTMLRGRSMVKQTKVGSPYVIKAMHEALEGNPGIKAAAYEANGGYLTGSDFSIKGKTLKALPTRDAALPLICALSLAKEGTVESLFHLFSRHTNADIIDRETHLCSEYSVDVGKRIIENLSPSERPARHIDLAGGRVIYDDEREEPLPDNLAKSVERIRLGISHYFSSQQGFGDPEAVNYLDGVRLFFSSGDIVHLRPSGNAPEFRFYAEADTQDRADEIVGMRAAIMSRMIREVSTNLPSNSLCVSDVNTTL